MSVGKKYVTKDDEEAFARKLKRMIRGINVGSTAAVPNSPGASRFIELDDVPSSYIGHGGEIVRVNAGETELEFSGLDLGELADVDVSSPYIPADGDVLTFLASPGIWIPLPPAGGGALDDLTDVNAPAPNDLDVLTWDAGAGEWIAAPAQTSSGSGGGGGAPADAEYIIGTADVGLANARVKQALYKNYDLCDYPASPDAMDDEFDDGSLNIKWTKQNEPGAPNAVSETAFAGMAWFGLPESASDNWATNFKMYQTAPSGAQTLGFIMRVAVGNIAFGASGGSFGGAGIYIGEPTGKDAVIVYFGFTAVGTVKAWGFSIDNDSRSAAANEMQQTFEVGQFVWLKITKDTADAYTSANTYQYWASTDGILWTRLGGTSFTFTNLATQVGVWTRFPATQSGDPVVHVAIDSFRRID